MKKIIVFILACLLFNLGLLDSASVKANTFSILNDVNFYSTAIAHLYDKIKDEERLQDEWREILVQISLSGHIKDADKLIDILFYPKDKLAVIKAKADHFIEIGRTKKAIVLLAEVSIKNKSPYLLLNLAKSYKKAGVKNKFNQILIEREKQMQSEKNIRNKYDELTFIVDAWYKAGNEKQVSDIIEKEFVKKIKISNFDDAYKIVSSLDTVLIDFGKIRTKTLKPLFNKINKAKEKEEKITRCLKCYPFLAMFGYPEKALKKYRQIIKKIKNDSSLKKSSRLKMLSTNCISTIGIAFGINGKIDKMKKLYTEFFKNENNYEIPMNMLITAHYLKNLKKPESIIKMLKVIKLDDKVCRAKCLIKAVQAFIESGSKKEVFEKYLRQITKLLTGTEQNLLIVEELLQTGRLYKKAGIALTSDEKKQLESLLSAGYSFEKMRKRVCSDLHTRDSRKGQIKYCKCMKIINNLQNSVDYYNYEVLSRLNNRKQIEKVEKQIVEIENQIEEIKMRNAKRNLDDSVENDTFLKKFLAESKALESDYRARQKPDLPKFKDNTPLKDYPLDEGLTRIKKNALCPLSNSFDYIVRVLKEKKEDRIWVECPHHGTKDKPKQKND